MAILNFVSQQLASSESFNLSLESSHGFTVETVDVLGTRHLHHNVSSIQWNVEPGIAFFGSKLHKAAYAPQIIFLREVTITFALIQEDAFCTTLAETEPELATA